MNLAQTIFIKEVIRSALTPELKYSKYMGSHPMGGFCYIASEAFYHLVGKHLDLVPCSIKHEGVNHWYLRHKESGIVIDITADQFNTTPDYNEGRGRGFLTKKPSKRAQVIINRVRETIGRDRFSL